MKYPFVLLINFYYPESGYGERLLFPPLGLGYLSQYLEEKGVVVNILDMGTGNDMASAYTLVLAKIADVKPDLLGVSLNSICFPQSMEILSNIKKKHPEIPIVVGGPHASSKGTILLNDHVFLDFVIVREGEKPLSELCAGEPIDKIQGLCWRDADGTVSNPDKPSINLSEFPFPRYNKFALNAYGATDAIGILTSRGCPFNCGFCQQSSLLGKKWRGRPVDEIIRELRYWKNKGKKIIHIIDDNFAMNKERVLTLSRRIVEENLNDLNYVLVGGIRINQTDEEVLVSLKEMGVKVIPFGIESGSDRVLKFIKKGMTVSQANKTIDLATRMGFAVKLFFIIGLPTETWAEVQMSFALAQKYPVREVKFFNFIPYRDTPLMDWLEEQNAHFFYPYDEYMSDFKKFQRIPVCQSDEGMSLAEKTKALEKADKISEFIRIRFQENL